MGGGRKQGERERESGIKVRAQEVKTGGTKGKSVRTRPTPDRSLERHAQTHRNRKMEDDDARTRF